MRATIRKRILPLHRWAGLTVGLVVVWMAITGAGMVFRTQLAPVLKPELLVVEFCNVRLPLDALADKARATHPGPQKRAAA